MSFFWGEKNQRCGLTVPPPLNVQDKLPSLLVKFELSSNNLTLPGVHSSCVGLFHPFHDNFQKGELVLPASFTFPNIKTEYTFQVQSATGSLVVFLRRLDR